MKNIKLIPTALLLALALPLHNQAFANAGRVVFVHGDVEAVSPDGDTRKLSRSSQVEAGDTIRTRGRSLVQMRMVDKAFIALRANSEVKIEEYNLGASKEQDSGIFSLLRGGFRAVTGIIGKRLRSSYKMRTSNATIGIRGTDYSARICNGDCGRAFGGLAEGGRIDDGLYVGVNDGGVSLTNDLGGIELDQLQFGYVKDAGSAPVALEKAPEFLYFNSRPPDPEEDSASGDDGGDQKQVRSEEPRGKQTKQARLQVEPEASDLTNNENVKEDVELEQVELTRQQIDSIASENIEAVTEDGSTISLSAGDVGRVRMVASSYSNPAATGSIASVRANPFSAVTLGASRDLQRFENQAVGGASGSFSRDTASNIELGFDPATGIAWGRWNQGSASFQNAAGSQSIDLNSNSLHWVAGIERPAEIALPITGTASYSLVGNTSPTDSLGNSGILGTANLTANFTARTVSTELAIGINNQVWNGAGSGMPISSNGQFSGAMNVSVDGAAIGPTGQAAGFFTNNATGAGMSYSLQNGPDSVTGVAIFGKK